MLMDMSSPSNCQYSHAVGIPTYWIARETVQWNYFQQPV